MRLREVRRMMYYWAHMWPQSEISVASNEHHPYHPLLIWVLRGLWLLRMLHSLPAHIQRKGLTVYNILENKLDNVGLCTDKSKSQVQIWAQDLRSIIHKTPNDRCYVTMPWQVAKNKIEKYTNNKWTISRWKVEQQHEHTKQS